jgi:small subunit ribosomal protein S3
MGHKIHPTGFRVGVIYDWQGKWYAGAKNYTELLHEDVKIRNLINRTLGDAGVSKIEIDRNANQVSITIHTAKPGIVIGRGGQKVEDLRTTIERLTTRRVRVNIQEIRVPEMDAYLVARSIADQLQRRVAFRRAMKQSVQRTMQRGAKGIKVKVSGRLGGSEMSRKEGEMDGRVPLHTLRADIDYGLAEAHTTFGRIGVKVWIYKGDILPPPKKRPQAAQAETGTMAPMQPAGPADAPASAPGAAQTAPTE